MAVSTSPLLTIGIPTFNRCDAVLSRIRELLEFSDELGFHILVIDDGSTDRTYETLKAEFAGQKVELHRNDQNSGIGQVVLRLVELAETPYLTVMSDEDLVEKAGLAALFSLLRERCPVFVSPRAQVREHDCYRGRRTTARMRADEFETASFYLSGLTFEVQGAKIDAEVVASLLPVNAAADEHLSTRSRSVLVCAKPLGTVRGIRRVFSGDNGAPSP